jgi:hypothetical protein
LKIIKKAIYTVITNGYDTLKIPRNVSVGYDYICFTDDENLKSDFWRVIVIKKESRHLQREIKILSHVYLPDYDFTIYVDGSMFIKRDLAKLYDRIRNNDILFSKHHSRNCVYKEAEAVLNLNKDSEENVKVQIDKYRDAGFPENFGMFQTGLIARRKTVSCAEFCDNWFSELSQHSHRDQLSVTYALWKVPVKVSKIESIEMYQLISVKPHIFNYKPIGSEINIIYSTPARTDKNIGKAYNDFMATVPNDAWVCLRDGDTMFMTPDWCKHIEDIIKENGNKFDLIGCMTNRLRGKHQLIDGMFDNESISDHLEVAKQIRSNKVEAVPGVAGLCLIFRKSLWEKVKFIENSIYFDTQFCKGVTISGGRIGVASGLYLFHLYRWGQKDPCNYTKHLK